jgi:hypothetical protein
VNASRSRALRNLGYRTNHQCSRRLHSAMLSFPQCKVVLHRNSWLLTQQYLCRVIGVYLPKLQHQWTAVLTLSDASTWRMLVDDNSLVAWYRIREQCTAASTLSALVVQREQLPEWYRMLVKITAQELMSVLFTRA